MNTLLHRNLNVRVLIVGEQTPACRSLAMALEDQPDITLVGVIGEGSAAIDLVQALRPEVLLLDVLMADIDPLEAIRIISEQYEDTKVIAFSSIVDDNLFLSALRAGAVGYVTKANTAEEIVAAVQAVGQDASYLPSNLAHRLIHHFSNSDMHIWRRAHDLTPREREVLVLLGDGYNNRKIAQTLNISVATVRIHVRHVQKKLGLHSRPQLAVFAEQYLVSPGQVA